MKKEQFPINPYGEEHPFEKVFKQIEELLDQIENNKVKPIHDVPDWVFNELKEIEKEYTRFEKVATQTLGKPKLDEKNFKKLMRSFPEDQRPIESILVDKARLLKDRAEEIKRDYFVPTQKEKAPEMKEEETIPSENSPMSLLGKEKESEEDLRATLEHKKKYSRMGGRKNWRPL